MPPCPKKADCEISNGRDGEWHSVIAVAGRAQASVTPRERVRDQSAGPDLWLAFAPVKRSRIDLIAEKATFRRSILSEALFRIMTPE